MSDSIVNNNVGVQQLEILKHNLQHIVQISGPKLAENRKICHGEIHLCQIINTESEFLSIFNPGTSFYVKRSIYLITSYIKQNDDIVHKRYAH